MAKKKLKDPDEGLAPDQYQELNKEFYDDYFLGYFQMKMAVLFNLIQKSEKILEIINDPDQKITLDDTTVSFSEIKQDDIIKFGKLELYTMYYHAIETFLRLFLAHITLPKCPWLEMNRETDYRKFKNKMKDLAKGKFDFKVEQDWTSDELISFVFTSWKQLPNDFDSDKIIETIREWIQWSANELLEVYDYNAYKHGLTLISGMEDFTLGDPDEIILGKHEECLTIIHKEKQGNRFVWKRTIKFTPFDFRSTCIIILHNLIMNIIRIGKWNYLNEKDDNSGIFLPEEHCVPYKLLEELSKTDKTEGIITTQMSMELRYFEDKN